MQKIKDWITKYYEGLAYLFFGGVATLLNLVIFAVFQAAFGTEFAAGPGNIIDNILCILFAYWTNRTFVFRSRNHGTAALKEFGQFVFFRLLTLVMDQVIITIGVQVVGPALRWRAPLRGTPWRRPNCGLWGSNCSARWWSSSPTMCLANCSPLKRSSEPLRTGRRASCR